MLWAPCRAAEPSFRSPHAESRIIHRRAADQHALHVACHCGANGRSWTTATTTGSGWWASRPHASVGAVDLGKRNVLGVLVDAIDYAAAVDRIAAAARESRPFAASALAVHGVMCGYREPHFRYRLNRLDLVTPDGQPVRWALNLLHGSRLKDRVRGTTLTLHVLERAAADGLPVISTEVARRCSPLSLRTSGSASRRSWSPVRSRRDFARCNDPSWPRSRRRSRALARASCSRVSAVRVRRSSRTSFAPASRVPYSRWVRHSIISRARWSSPPERLQALGLEWAWRLALEPRRLWRRYLLLNLLYLSLLLLQKARILEPDPRADEPESDAMVPA